MKINILEYLEETAARVPEKLAFSDGVTGLTFRELRDCARAAGTYLLAQGLRREPVPVRMGRRPETVAAYLGVLYAGCYYVPIDDDMPAVRVNGILEQMKPRLIITDALFDEMCSTSPVDALLDEARKNVTDTDPVYVVFTSGSTGVPKGVAASHRSVIDYAENLSDALGFDGDTVFGCQAPLTIDACLKELLPTLKFGAVTYIIPKNLFMFPLKLTEFLNKHSINTLCWVASALTMLSAYGALDQDPPKHLHTVAFGGEVFPPKQLEAWLTALPDTRFFNLYGPTEATGMSCCYKVPRDFPVPLPVGKPFRNTEVILIKENGEIAAPGETGEIYIRGAGLTLGYFNNPQKTAEVFVQNPLHNMFSDPVYKTGDLGRFNEAGELIFLSRRDSQIKHMGHRIELGEIEAVAEKLEGVREVCCVYDSERGKIVLFFIGEIAVSRLAAQLRDILPRYMVPGAFVPLEAFPRTGSGKTNRKALLARLNEDKEG